MDPFPLTPDHAPALVPLVEGLAADHGEIAAASAKDLARELADGWLIGFGIGRPLCAYALFLRHSRAQLGERGLLLHHIFVAPDARRRGHATALLLAGEAEGRRLGCAYLVIGAHEGNQVAKAFYEARGYELRTPTFWRFRKTL
ncbi:MAG: GNAT family N-acetyltransferase [Pseudomonadota bacterium]